MVEVDGDDDDENGVPGENDEPDMDYGEEEELVPIKSKHGGLFGADVDAVKFWS